MKESNFFFNKSYKFLMHYYYFFKCVKKEKPIEDAKKS